MALVACSKCRQPFHASCHDSACIDAACPRCEYGDEDAGGAAQGDVEGKGPPDAGETP